jgi:hypothetical protein
MAKSSMTDFRLMEIAMHQAGHGVIGHKLCGDNGPLTIKDASGALCSSPQETVWKIVTRDEDNIVALFAGIAAQRLLNPSASDEEARHDYPAIDDIISFLPKQDSGVLKERLRKKAELLVRDNVEAIEAVAEALKLLQSLDICDCGEIVNAVGKGKDWHDAFPHLRLG